MAVGFKVGLTYTHLLVFLQKQQRKKIRSHSLGQFSVSINQCQDLMHANCQYHTGNSIAFGRSDYTRLCLNGGCHGMPTSSPHLFLPDTSNICSCICSGEPNGSPIERRSQKNALGPILSRLSSSLGSWQLSQSRMVCALSLPTRAQF